MLSKNTPRCPGDPEAYVLVNTKEGIFWRRKRGSVKPAGLNAGFQKSVEVTKIVAPAAKRVLKALQPYLKELKTGRLNIRIGNALRRSLKEKDELQVCYLNKIELQQEHPLDGLLIANYTVDVGSDEVKIKIPIDSGTIKRMNALVTDYYFEAVILYGDINKENGLRTDSAESDLYSINSGKQTNCVLELSLPEKGDWCLLLKVSMLEGNEVAAHNKFYRMRVVSGSGL